MTSPEQLTLDQLYRQRAELRDQVAATTSRIVKQIRYMKTKGLTIIKTDLSDLSSFSVQAPTKPMSVAYIEGIEGGNSDGVQSEEVLATGVKEIMTNHTPAGQINTLPHEVVSNAEPKIDTEDKWGELLDEFMAEQEAANAAAADDLLEFMAEQNTPPAEPAFENGVPLSTKTT
jgi:hypothetical protein